MPAHRRRVDLRGGGETSRERPLVVEIQQAHAVKAPARGRARPLPLAERGGIGLSRSGADLVVTVGDVRRRIALPSVRPRRSTEGASFEHGRLMIDFAADPALWPASLAPTPLVGTG
jgi:hypothetical protein